MSDNLNTNEIYQSLNAGEKRAWEYVNRRNVGELKTLALQNRNQSLELRFSVFMKIIKLH